LMDQALRVALGGVAADDRVKASVLAIVRAASVEQFRTEVLADTVQKERTGVGEASKALQQQREWLTGHSWTGSWFQRLRGLQPGDATCWPVVRVTGTAVVLVLAMATW